MATKFIDSTGLSHLISKIKAAIPTKTSQITNDSGFLTSHQTIKQDGIIGATVNRYGLCSTAAGTAAKTASISTGSFSLEAGSKVAIKFTYANNAANPTLNVNGTGAKPIYRYGTTVPGTGAATSWGAGSVVSLTYDGSGWIINNWLNDSYSVMTLAQAKAGTDTANRVIQATVLHDAIEAGIVAGLQYSTTAPTAANTDGIKVVYLTSEPATKYAGWLYLIAES